MSLKGTGCYILERAGQDNKPCQCPWAANKINGSENTQWVQNCYMLTLKLQLRIRSAHVPLKSKIANFYLSLWALPWKRVRFQWCGLHRKLNIVSKESWPNPMPLSCPQRCFCNALLRDSHSRQPIHLFQSRIALKLTLSCMRDHQHHEE